MSRYADTYDTYIPERWFAAVRDRNDLAYMVPSDDDKLRESAKKWARGRYSEDVPFSTIEIENDPVSEFEIVGTVKRSSRQSNRSLFRVRDPRGFVLELSPENFFTLMQDVVVKRGTIQTPLAWARHGSDNILVPKTASAYHRALKAGRARRGDGVSVSDLELGWDVEIQRGIRGRFLGRWDIVGYTSDRSQTRLMFNERRGRVRWHADVNTNRRYAFLTDGGEVIVHGSPEPHIVHARDTLDGYGEAARLANASSIKNSSGYSRSIVGLTRCRGDSIEFTTRPVTDPQHRAADRSRRTPTLIARHNKKDVVIPVFNNEITLGRYRYTNVHTVRDISEKEWTSELHASHEGADIRPDSIDAYTHWREIVITFETEGVTITAPVSRFS